MLEQREEQVLGADVVVAEAKCLAEGELEHLLGRLVVGDQRGRPLDPGGERHGAPHPLGVSAEVGEDPGRDGVGLRQQPEDEVVGADALVAGL